MAVKGQEGVPDGYKRCHQCREIKEIIEFGIVKNGINSRCKACNRANAAVAYRKKHPWCQGAIKIRQDSIIRMISKMDKEYEKADSARFFSYVEKKYGYKYCKHCNSLHPISDFNVIKTQPPNQCIICFRERKKNETKKILQTKDGLNKAYMRNWFKNRGISARDAPDDVKNVVIKMVELNSLIRHTGGI